MRLYIYWTLLLCWGVMSAQTTYYSRNATSGGNWDDVNAWTLNSDGSGGPTAATPGQTDDIVVLNGHTITVDNELDNGGPTTSASGTYTVGAFAGNGTARFYHNGLITIDVGGTLTITDDTGAMLEDTVYVNGTLSASAGGNNDDLINAGYMHVYSGATLSVGDDLILIDNSETILDNTALSSDDIYMDGTNALICGDGSLDIGGAIQEFNGADANQQTCDTFTINCTDGDCCDDGTTVGSCAGNGDDGSFGGGGSFVLPVELLDFAILERDGNLRVEWSTSSETNNDFFTLETSVDGELFEQEVKVSGNGTTSNLSQYRHEITNPPTILFIRLSQTDFDGTSEVLGIKVFTNDQAPDPIPIIYPNPAHNEFSIQGELVRSIEIVDLTGRVVYQSASINTESIDVSDWTRGTYIVRWYLHLGSTKTSTLVLKD